MTSQIDSTERAPIEAPARLGDFGLTVGRAIRCESRYRPEVTIARIRRALREIVFEAEAEIDRVKRFLDGEPLATPDRDHFDEHPGVTSALWVARDLEHLEEVCADPSEGRVEVADLAGSIAQSLIEDAIAREPETSGGGGLSTRAVMVKLVTILLGADAAYGGLETRMSREELALERDEARAAE